MKKHIFTTCAAGVVLTGGAVYGIGRAFADFALKRGTNADDAVKKTLNTTPTPAEETESILRRAAAQWREGIKVQELELTSTDGLALKGYLYPNNTASHRYVILMHGFQDTHVFMEPFAVPYYEDGFHVFIIDQRAHGASEGDYTTMGWKEQDDLRGWISKLLELDPQAEFLLHGVSMGASSILLCAGSDLPGEVKGIVSDCAYSSLWKEYEGKLHEMFHLPAAPLLITAELAARITPGVPIHRVNPVEAVKCNHVPVLFIHGEADDYNPVWMAYELYLHNAGEEKALLMIPSARHARSIFTDYDRYVNAVRNFEKMHVPY